MAKRTRRLLAGVLALFATLGFGAILHAATCSPTTFITAPEYPAGLQPYAIATGDFNRDGVTDLVATNDYNYSTSVSVLLGQAGVGFGPPLLLPLSYPASSVSAMDLNSDGNPDILVASYSQIYVFLGNGDGTFQGPTSFPVSNSGMLILAAGDLNSDGAPDAVVADSYSNTLYILLGSGTGSFGPATPVDIGAATAAIALGDLNSDGALDIVTTNTSSGTITVLLGHGDGTFGSPAQFVAGQGPLGLAIADLNSDGRQDVAVAIQGYVAVLLGNGDGTFLAPLDFTTAGPALAVLIAEVTADGVPDLIVTEPSNYSAPGQLEILAGSASGTFSALHSYMVGYDPRMALSLDSNADGIADILVADTGDFAVTVLLGEGGGAFQGIESHPFPTQVTDLVVADFNRDGRSDLAVSTYSFGCSQVRLYLGTAGGWLQDAGTLFTNTEFCGDMFSLAAADLNHDGDTDLVFLDYYASTVVSLLGNGDATFAAPLISPMPLEGSLLSLGDFNGDGNLDVTAVFSSYPQTTVMSLLGAGDGTFQFSGTLAVPLPIASTAAADVNGDGRDDFVAADGGGNQASVFLANADGSLQSPVSYPAGNDPTSIGVGDFNNDGAQDLIVANSNSFNVTLFLGQGDGTFPTSITVGLLQSPTSLLVGDFNGDGNLDVATADLPDNDISVLLGTGNGTFQTPEVYETGANPIRIAPVVLRPSGATDLVVSNYYDGTFVTLRNAALIASPPLDQPVCIGSAATFGSAASGFGHLTYQWRKNGIDLTDGGNISGSQTPTLTINPTGLSDAGNYDVVVADLCTQVTSAGAALTVSQQPSPPTITAPLSAPPDQAGVGVSVPDVAGHTFDWTVTGGTITAGQGTHAILITAGSAGTTMSVQVVEMASAGCGSAPSMALIQVDFADVPASNPFHDFVDTLARDGVTAGCGGGNFCPSDAVLRSSMAVFLLRADHGSAYVPPPAVGVFGDVPASNPFAPWIEEIYNEGITGGCSTNPLEYCPNNVVTRAGMAVFLLRAEHGPTYAPPPAVGIFGDVPPSNPFAPWIEQLYNEGITGGCSTSPLIYCPGNSVTRAQMAVFLVATFNLQ